MHREKDAEFLDLIIKSIVEKPDKVEITRVVGMKHNARVNLKINEPEGGKRSVSHQDAVAELKL